MDLQVLERRVPVAEVGERKAALGHLPRRLDQPLPFDLTAPVAAPGVHEHRECRRAQKGECAEGDVLGRRGE